MATYYAPRINAQDYAAFQNMSGLDLPATYEEWLQQQAGEKARHQDDGDTTIDVDVTPAEFVSYLNAARTTGDLKELERFASTKASARTTTQ